MNKITKKIYSMIEEWNKEGYSPTAINCGCCEAFAWELELTFCRDKYSNGRLRPMKGRAMWGEDFPALFNTDVDPTGHCFFVYNGSYYDSESPEGTDTPDQLQYYQRILGLTNEWKELEYA